MSKCRFVYDDHTRQKVLIPGCWGSLHRDDLSGCTCPSNDTPKMYERREYNEEVKQLREERDILLKENNQLIRVIKKLTQQKTLSEERAENRDFA